MDTLIFAIITLITFGLSIGSYLKLIIAYNKYKNIPNKVNLSGCEIAEKILENNDLGKTYVIQIKGFLEDHYDPNRHVIRLSPHVFHANSLAATVIAAHECALAIKDKNKSWLIKLRNLLLPTVNIITYLSYIVLLLALFSHSLRFLQLAISIMFLIVLFHCLTFKLEQDASKKACLELKKLQLVKKSEIDDIDLMSNATSYMYMSSLISLIVSLFSKLLSK